MFYSWELQVQVLQLLNSKTQILKQVYKAKEIVKQLLFLLRLVFFTLI